MAKVKTRPTVAPVSSNEQSLDDKIANAIAKAMAQFAATSSKTAQEYEDSISSSPLPVDTRHPVDVASDRQRKHKSDPIGPIRADSFKEKVVAYKLDENNVEQQDTMKTLHLRNENRTAVRRELAKNHRQLNLVVQDENGVKIGTIPLEFRTSKWYCKDGKGGHHHELQYGVASPSIHVPLGNGQFAKIVSSGLYFMVDSIVGE